MSTTVSSAFAPLFPLDIRTFKGKLIMVVGITTFSALLVLFTVLFILGYNKALTGCADKVLFWWIGSLIQEALLLILYSLFAFYIWKTSPSTSTGYEFCIFICYIFTDNDEGEKYIVTRKILLGFHLCYHI